MSGKSYNKSEICCIAQKGSISTQGHPVSYSKIFGKYIVWKQLSSSTKFYFYIFIFTQQFLVGSGDLTEYNYYQYLPFNLPPCFLLPRQNSGVCSCWKTVVAIAVWQSRQSVNIFSLPQKKKKKGKTFESDGGDYMKHSDLQCKI